MATEGFSSGLLDPSDFVQQIVAPRAPVLPRNSVARSAVTLHANPKDAGGRSEIPLSFPCLTGNSVSRKRKSCPSSC